MGFGWLICVEEMFLKEGGLCRSVRLGKEYIPTPTFWGGGLPIVWCSDSKRPPPVCIKNLRDVIK